LAPGYAVQLGKYSLSREISVAQDRFHANAGISAPLLSWNLQLQLKTSKGGLVAQLTNPSFPWATASNMYDCTGKKIAGMKWKMKNLNIDTYAIYDANGGAIAVVEASNTANKHTVLLKNQAGQNMMQISMESLPWTQSIFGLFGSFKNAEVANLSPVASLPPLLKDPRILSLLAGGELVGRVSPLAYIVGWILAFGCFFFCCCEVLCKCCSKKNKTTPSAEKLVPNENERLEEQRLLDANNANTYKEVQQQPDGLRGIMSFCCRRDAPKPSGNAPH
jgi:hypothetical protein